MGPLLGMLSADFSVADLLRLLSNKTTEQLHQHKDRKPRITGVHEAVKLMQSSLLNAWTTTREICRFVVGI